MPTPGPADPGIEIHPLVWVLAALNWALRIGMVLVVMHKRRPNVALSWIVIVLFQPVLGAILFLLIGRVRIDPTTTRRYARLARAGVSPGVVRGVVEVPERFADLVRLSESLNLLLPTGGNRIELVGTHTGFVGGLVEDIDRAATSVSLLYYIFLDDPSGRAVSEALGRAAGRGVRCRLLVDAVGSRVILSKRAASLRAAGVEVRAALPVRPWRALLVRADIRNHRKLAVIDGRVAWTGSHNLCEDHYGNSTYGPWIDLTTRISGPAVGHLSRVFEEDWYAQTEEATEEELPPAETGGDVASEGEAGRAVVQVIRTGATGVSDSLEPLLIAAMHEADHRIVLTAPYFVPTPGILQTLRIAVLRGVRVDVIVPERSNHPLVHAAGRACFEEMLEAGVNIHLHSPGLLHSKTMLVDDSFALIGTANFDVRSISLNYELKLLVFDRETVSDLHATLDGYLRASVSLRAETWTNRGRVRRFGENVARLFTPLL